MQPRVVLLAAIGALVATDAAPSPSLRGLSVSDSPCNAVTTASACRTTRDDDATPCQWCNFPAVGEECLSAAQATSLPPGVSTCEDPAATPRSFSFAG
eukprot:CAMPEP_0194322560 /NCGR_PEP_ID=MMETSP0171-20130528/21302_1 /TAXON_ID=218684 /ORGANISM="Corethron pennatum, Strain L29A3" /LENGTH=97 /DNA_ID=CAMNT_0039080861 /DNA_START=71 /DNA_END=361 /DNA_ORIENTATION=+